MALLLLLLLSAVRYASADANFINTTCGHLIFNSDNCVRLLELDQRSYTATTNEELANIALDIITKNYTKVREFLNETASQHHGEPIQAPCVMCVIYYDDALPNLQSAQLTMAKKTSYDLASTLVEHAVDAPSLCESQFIGAGVPSPVKQTDKFLFDAYQVTLDLIRLLVS